MLQATMAVEPIGSATTVEQQKRHISAKELTTIVTATTTWGKAWRGHLICVLLDNTAAAITKSHRQGC